MVIETDLGRIELMVCCNSAPQSSRAFLTLVDEGVFEQLGAFYRVVRRDNDHGTPPICVVQGGIDCPHHPPPPIAHETTMHTRLRHQDGTVSLARGTVGTATGATFFICVGDQPALDFGGKRNVDGQGFAAFGRIRAGMDVVRSIHGLPARGLTNDSYLAGQLLDPPVRMRKVARRTS